MLPGRARAVIGQERPRRVRDLEQTRLGHLEHADLVGRPEAVLRRAEQPQGRVPLALEVDDRVDEVLERLRTGDRAVLRHVADEDDGDAVALREVHQPERRLADLADAAGGPVELVHGRRLDRVDDDDHRAFGPGGIHDPPDVVLRQHADTVRRRTRQQPETGGPESHLARGLLARRVQHRTPAGRPRQSGRGLEEERRLADPRLAADEDERSRDEPAAEDAVELVDADAQTRQVRVGDGREAGRGAARHRSRRRTGPRAPRAASRGRPSRRGCSTARRRGTGLPSAGTTPRRTGRRSGSSAAPSLGRRTGGADHRASTGVRGSARWMSRPASGSLSTMIVEPGSYEPSRSCSARTSSIMFWMTRRSGRAP